MERQAMVNIPSVAGDGLVQKNSSMKVKPRVSLPGTINNAHRG
jgi:hypothetical protein